MRRARQPGAALLARLRLTIAQQPSQLEHVDRALKEAEGQSSGEHLETSVLALAASQWDPAQLDALLDRAKNLPRGRQRVYNSAIATVARDHEPRRTERAVALLQRMRDDNIKPSNLSLQHVFEAARGEATGVDQLLEILSEQMRHGLRPSRAVFDSLLRATPTEATPSASPSGRLPLLLQVLDACSMRASGETARELARLSSSANDVAALEPLLATLPTARRRALDDEGLLLAVKARHVDPEAAVSAALARGREPSRREFRALLWACAAVDAHECCAILLESMWSRGLRADERTARRLLHVAGEGAGRGEAGALELLDTLRAALFGEGTASKGPLVQRSGARRSAAAEHEIVRTLARATWRAGLGDATSVKEVAMARLEAVGVPPRPKLLATLAHLIALDGDFKAALRLLASPPTVAAGSGSDGRQLGAAGAAVAGVRHEGAYLAVISAVRASDEIEHVIGALHLMLRQGVAPTLRTRIALARMAARVQGSVAGAHQAHPTRAGHVSAPPLPGTARFWQPLPLPWDALFDALRREEGAAAATQPTADEVRAAQVAAAADLVIDARAAALLEQISAIMRASSDGGALATLLKESSERLKK